MIREPAVAGTFYMGSAEALNAQVDACMPKGVERRRVKALMSPHAGFMYSGAVAGGVYAAIEPPETFVLLGPNHTGLGTSVSMMAEGSWDIPTARVEVDSALASAIASRSALISQDTDAHSHEHSIEVQLPFIARIAPAAKIVPIAIMRAGIDELREIGHAVAGAIEAAEYPVVIVASSDMSHFLPEGVARRLDHMALESLLALDPDGLLEVVRRERISMCGVLPAVAMLEAAIKLGATRAELTSYATSGEVSGDRENVVGYAGAIVY